MSTTLAVTLPWGRYHATPWGRHVNEGAIEWPPSPWRLLRALYATAKTRCTERTEAEVLSILEALVDAPTYVLPDFVEAHTRHYMPDLAYRSGAAESTDKVIDAFAVVERGAQIVIEWPVELTSSQRELLGFLAHRVPYLGRAETICEVSLLDEATSRTGHVYAPLAADEPGVLSGETVRLLAFEAPLSRDSLTATTTEVRRARLRRPAGTRWVDYPKPEPFRGRFERPVVRPSPKRVDAVRWAIASSALPSAHAAVAMGDVLRRASMSRFGRAAGGGVSSTLTGKDEGGKPLTGHRHAHYLSIDENGDGLLDHLVVWAPGGLDREEVAALASLPAQRGSRHVEDFRACELGLEGVGSISTVAPEIIGPARRWRSATPFAPGHHGRKATPWNEHVVSQVRSELAVRDLPVPSNVAIIPGPALAFRRHRPTKERLRDARRAVNVVVEFSEPISGPIVLGALCHFGLGLLVPDGE